MAGKYAFVLVGGAGDPQWSRFERFPSHEAAIAAARLMAEAEIGEGAAGFALLVGHAGEDKAVRWLGAFEWRDGVTAWKPGARAGIALSGRGEDGAGGAPGFQQPPPSLRSS